MKTSNLKPADILNFWFYELTPKDWFIKDAALDDQIRQRFLPIYEHAAVSELSEWRSTAEGRLAEIIVLDQFARNLFRDSPRAFAADPLALALAQAAIQLGEDQKLPVVRRAFLYMPFMHSESSLIHRQAMHLFQVPGMESNFDFEVKHQKIIDRFGRYPHRNQALGRKSTPEELQFLKQPDSSF